MKTPRKVTTEDKYIDSVENILGIKYPKVIRDMLLKSNGFSWGYYNFFPVRDEEDLEHTFDDVVRENNNPNGWSNYLPEGYVAIANEDSYCLALSKVKDGKVYYFDNERKELSVYADNEEELVDNLNREEDDTL